MSKRYGSIEDRFHAQYIPEPNSGCWLWFGPVDENGYGRVRNGSKKIRVHRLSYEIHKGPIPQGLVACHRCDVPGCVNPEHLFVGTLADNIADRDAKGRQARGERGAGSKLTSNNVLSILADGRTHRAIGEDYGVSHRTVGEIKRGRKWKHLSRE